MAPRATDESFGPSRQGFEEVVGFLGSNEAGALSHAEIEERLSSSGRELLRQLYQDHLDLRAQKEEPVAGVADIAGVGRPSIETGHRRTLTTVFGEVVVNRLAYRAKGKANLHLADAVLNLPEERHSHGVRALAAIEASRGSFEQAQEAIERATGQQVGKRQVEQLAQRSAVDFEEFYSVSPRHRSAPGDVVVLSADAKGIVMRPDALRPATAKAAANSTAKLATRLSKGEKRNRKRMAEVGSVYEVAPVPRTPYDVMAKDEGEDVRPPAPKAKEKWLTASVVDDAASVVAQLFDEAERRDPTHQSSWVALVDGNNHQIDRIETESAERKVDVTVVVDFIHVLEYLWGAAWSFFNEGDAEAERWVKDKAIAVLEGKASTVAASITRKATCLGLDVVERKNADACAGYLLAKRDYLDYPTALEQGWPIATGIIEGACRYLVKDRLDITGARWGLAGAEAVLKLRAIRSNGDFERYWDMHLDRERKRVHESRYAGNVIPRAA